jgi:DNA-binding SARP family transcriptional activator
VAVALRTFGEFSIARDGVPLVSKGKAQKKPLELLKALITHGGRGVDATMLTGLVWPDAEGDDAKTSFDSNLYRLRKLLDVDGALSSRTASCRSTRSRVARRVGARGGARRAATSTPRSRCIAATSSRSTPVAVDAAARDRLQNKLVRAVLAAATRSSARAHGRARASLYERTLEVDNLAEAVYRRLMVCLREEGNPSGRPDGLQALPRTPFSRARPRTRRPRRGDPANRCNSL